MKFKMLLFDLGGVIIDILPEKSIKEFSKLSKYSQEMFRDIDYREKNKESDLSDIFFNFEKGLISKNDFRSKIKKLGKLDIDDFLFDQIWNLTIFKLDKKILDKVLSLKSKYSIMILSNTNEIHKEYFDKMCVKIYQKTFDQLFDRVFYSFDLNARKPNKNIYELVLDKTGINPNEIIFFDDMNLNLIQPKKLGINTYHVNDKNDLAGYLDGFGLN